MKNNPLGVTDNEVVNVRALTLHFYKVSRNKKPGKFKSNPLQRDATIRPLNFYRLFLSELPL